MNKSVLFGVLASALVLTACKQSTTVPSNIVLPGSEQSYISNPTYVQGTDEYDAFYAINAFRRSVGLGYWQQNVYLDQAAAAHMAYSASNCAGSANPFMDDTEVDTGACTAYYLAASPSGRAIAKGYYILENTVTQNNVPTAAVGELYSVGPGVNVVEAMVNTIYHRSGLMAQSTRAVGMARYPTGPAAATSATHWWFSHGRLDAGQSVPSNFMSGYPVTGQTGVPLYMCPEYPSVYSNVSGFNFATSTSSPVSLTTSTLVDLNINTFTITPAGSSTPLTGQIWTMANDPNLNTKNYSSAAVNLTEPPTPVPTISANEAFWVGDQPFQPNTTYNVYVEGTTYLIPYGITNGFTQTWNFTTGTTTTCESL